MSDQLERQVADLEKRVRLLEKAEEVRRKVRHYPPPQALMADKERPGRALGVDTSLGPYAEFNED